MEPEETAGGIAYLIKSVTPVIGLIGDVRVLNKMGFDALATKNYTVAVPAFFRALEVDATNAQAQLDLGEAYYFAAQYAMAINPLRTALQLNATLNDAHAYLGLVYEQRSDPRSRACRAGRIFAGLP